MAVPGNPGADKAAATPTGGAGMTASTVETAGEGGGDADGLRGSPMNAPTQGILDRIMPQKRPDPAAIRQEKCLPISESGIESLERPMVPMYIGIGHSPSGKSLARGQIALDAPAS